VMSGDVICSETYLYSLIDLHYTHDSVFTVSLKQVEEPKVVQVLLNTKHAASSMLTALHKLSMTQLTL